MEAPHADEVIAAIWGGTEYGVVGVERCERRFDARHGQLRRVGRGEYDTLLTVGVTVAEQVRLAFRPALSPLGANRVCPSGERLEMAPGTRCGVPGNFKRGVRESLDEVAKEGRVESRRRGHADRSPQAGLGLTDEGRLGGEVQPVHATRSVGRQRDQRTAVHRMRAPARRLPESVPLTFDTPIRRRCPTGTSR